MDLPVVRAVAVPTAAAKNGCSIYTHARQVHQRILHIKKTHKSIIIVILKRVVNYSVYY